MLDYCSMCLAVAWPLCHVRSDCARSIDESIASKAVSSAQNRHQRAAAMMSSSLTFGPSSSSSSASASAPVTPERFVAPPPVPSHAYGPQGSDEPRSARVRMQVPFALSPACSAQGVVGADSCRCVVVLLAHAQRAMQSQWNPLTHTDYAGSNTRTPVKLEYRSSGSEISAKQRFHESIRGSIQFG